MQIADIPAAITSALSLMLEGDKLKVLNQVVADCSGSPETATACKDAMRAARDRCAPDGYAMRSGLSPNFMALREATGAAYDAHYNARVAAGLPRFEVNCGNDCCADHR